MKGFYYLHQNGDLICKRFRPETDSPFVRRTWPVDNTDRKTAWIILLEGRALKANRTRLQELESKWKCELYDLPRAMVEISNAHMTTDLARKGLVMYLRNRGIDPDKFFAAFRQGVPNYPNPPQSWWDQLKRRKEPC